MDKFENLLMDFYELTMGQGYFDKHIENETAYFDVFFRKVPDDGSFVIANGISKCVEYLLQFHFEPSDIEYLESLNLFSKESINSFVNVSLVTYKTFLDGSFSNI